MDHAPDAPAHVHVRSHGPVGRNVGEGSDRTAAGQSAGGGNRPSEVQPTKVVHVYVHAHLHGTVDTEPNPRLDIEKLEAYQSALQVQALLPQLTGRCGHSLRDQVERAAASILLNIAEGCGRRGRRDRGRFYGIARGSAMECCVAIDIIRVRGVAPLVACRQARVLLLRVIAMLTRLEQVARGHRQARARAGRSESVR
ncbi:MAG: four helix bundle protein [Polyangiaceae bacterium]